MPRENFSKLHAFCSENYTVNRLAVMQTEAKQVLINLTTINQLDVTASARVR